jgi:hypothetical protein
MLFLLNFAGKMSYEDVRSCSVYCDDLGAAVMNSSANVDGSIAKIIMPVVDTSPEGSANYRANSMCNSVAQESSSPSNLDFSTYVFMFLDEQNFTTSNVTHLMQSMRSICSTLEGKQIVFVFPETDLWSTGNFTMHSSKAKTIILPYSAQILRQQTFALDYCKALIHQSLTSLLLPVVYNTNIMASAVFSNYRRYNLLTLLTTIAAYRESPELLSKKLMALPSRHFRKFVAEVASIPYETMVKDDTEGARNLATVLKSLPITLDDESKEQIQEELDEAQADLAKMKEEQRVIHEEIKDLRYQLVRLESIMTPQELDAVRAHELKCFELAFPKDRAQWERQQMLIQTTLATD